MTEQWGEIARRGEMKLYVLTPKSAAARNVELRSGAKLAAFVEPDDRPPFYLLFRSIARLAEWCVEMEPHGLEVVTLDEADQAEGHALLESLKDAVRAGGSSTMH